eukprot:4829875-Alexandrium_andersonii.AAC.1
MCLPVLLERSIRIHLGSAGPPNASARQLGSLCPLAFVWLPANPFGIRRAARRCRRGALLRSAFWCGA